MTRLFLHLGPARGETYSRETGIAPGRGLEPTQIPGGFAGFFRDPQTSAKRRPFGGKTLTLNQHGGEEAERSSVQCPHRNTRWTFSAQSADATLVVRNRAKPN